MENDLEKAAIRFLSLATRLRRLGSGTPPLEGAGISPSHLALLEYAAVNKGRGIQETAEGLNLATPTVSISVSQLEKKGLIAREPDPEDGRAVQLFLTQKGQEIHQQAHTFHLHRFEQLLHGLTPTERDTLLTLLERAIQAAEETFQGDER